jgi:MraZ protein
MPLTGSFARAIDEKLRVAIPKRLRESLDCPVGGVLYVSPGTDGSLAIFTESQFARLAERLAKESPTRQEVRAFVRLLYAQSQQVELDAQGRIRIPLELAELAHLEKDVVLLGVQDRLELWAADRWKAYLTEKRPQFDQIAESALGGSA